MTFVDSNVILDVIGRDQTWYEWSFDELSLAAEAGPVFCNAVVVAELSRSFASSEELQATLAGLLLDDVPIDGETAFLAGKRFVSYRQAPERPRTRVVADFLIGAHAVSLGVRLLTRDTRLYRRYFPELILIAPETENG